MCSCAGISIASVQTYAERTHFVIGLRLVFTGTHIVREASDLWLLPPARLDYGLVTCVALHNKRPPRIRFTVNKNVIRNRPPSGVEFARMGYNLAFAIQKMECVADNVTVRIANRVNLKCWTAYWNYSVLDWGIKRWQSRLLIVVSEVNIQECTATSEGFKTLNIALVNRLNHQPAVTDVVGRNPLHKRCGIKVIRPINPSGCARCAGETVIAKTVSPSYFVRAITIETIPNIWTIHSFRIDVSPGDTLPVYAGK